MADAISGIGAGGGDEQTALDYLGRDVPVAFRAQPALPVAGPPAAGVSTGPAGPGGIGAGAGTVPGGAPETAPTVTGGAESGGARTGAAGETRRLGPTGPSLAEIIQKGLSAGGKLEDILQKLLTTKEQDVTIPGAGGPINLSPEALQELQFAELGFTSPGTAGPEALSAAQSLFPGKAIGLGELGATEQIAEAQPALAEGEGVAGAAGGAGLSGLAGAGAAAALALPGILKALGVDVPKEFFQAQETPIESMFATELLGGGTYRKSREAAGKAFAQGLRVLPSEIEMARTPEDIKALFGQEVGTDPNAPFGIRINPEAAPKGGFYELGAQLGPLAKQTADVGNLELALMYMAQQGDPTAKAKLAELNQRGLAGFLGANYGDRAPVDLQAFQEMYTNLGKYTGQPLSEEAMLREFYGGGGPEFSNIRTALGVQNAGLDPNNPADAAAIARAQLTDPRTGQLTTGVYGGE